MTSALTDEGPRNIGTRPEPDPAPEKFEFES